MPPLNVNKGAHVGTVFGQSWVRRLLWLIVIVVIIGSIGAGSKLSVLLEALRPPVLPEHVEIEIADWQSGQNWTDETIEEFHHKSQGSRALNIPCHGLWRWSNQVIASYLFCL